MHIRRQQQCLIDIPGPKILAHSSSLNQTRSKLNSDYSDRLLDLSIPNCSYAFVNYELNRRSGVGGQ
jgi:hypothetical protein